jgi:hypothetical protein
LSPLEDIGLRAGIELSTFRLVYRRFSAQVHGLPLSFYRTTDHNRGRGVHSEVEEGYTCLSISFAIGLLVRSRDEMMALFADAIVTNPQTDPHGEGKAETRPLIPETPR